VQFGKTVTKDGRVLPVGPLWPAKQFDACYEEMRSLEKRLDDLIRVIKPAPVPGVIQWVSFSDPVRVETGLGEGALKPWRFNPRK